MGILPSRESHEYPGAFHFAQSGSHAMAILPLTEHFFPSVDSLAFKQLYAGREMQSAKYNFSLMSPELLRRYRHRAMEQRHVKEEVGEEAMAPPAGRRKPQPYLQHGQPPGDGNDTSGKWVGVNTIDASNYSQFFKDDTQCVSPNSPALPFLDGDEEVCEELQRPNPAAHWHTHDATKQLIQDEDNQLGFAEGLNYLSLDGKGGGLRCLPSSLSRSCSSGQHLRLGQARNTFTEAAAAADTDAAASAAPLTAEERDVLNRFFARSPEALYNALVVEPNKGFLVDTNKEMCKLYAAERRWKEARNVVRAYRRQCKQDAAADEAAQPASGRSHESPKDSPQSRITKEEADEAAKVPPPPVFLRPVPQVIMVRMSREEEETTRAAYLAEQQQKRNCTAAPQQSRSGDGDSIAPSTSSSVAAAGADEGTGVLRSPTPSSLSPLHVPTSRYHRFEDDPKYKDGRIHLVEEDGVLYMFAYNTAYVDPRERVRQQREELLKQQQRDPLKQHEDHGSSSGRKEACRSPSRAPATVINTAAEATARATTAGSPGCPTTERGAVATLKTDGNDDDHGELSHMSRQTSFFYHTVSSFGKEEDEVGREAPGNSSKGVTDASGRRASATAASPVAAAVVPAVAVARAESVEKEDDGDNDNDDEEESTAISSASHGSRGRQRQSNTTALADDDASLQRSDEKPSTSSEDDDDDEEDDCDVRRKRASDSAPSASTTSATISGTSSAATKEKRSRVVQQLELVTAAPFILPICPVRVVGCNGYAESRCRGTPWLRGYEDEPEEDAYVESLPVKPPVMSGGGFIDANIGDKILSRAYLLGFQVYRNVCLDAGLPETLTRPFWTLGLLSNIPLLQISREMRFRMRAAAAEVELGYRGLRDMIKGTENDLQSYIYGFSDILPYLERASLARIEQAEAEAKTAVAAAAAAEGGDGGGVSEDAAASQSSPLLPAGSSSSERVEEEGHKLPNWPVSLAIPTRSSQAVAQHNLLFPRSEMEFYTQFTIRGNQSLSRVRCEAQESFFHLIAEATAPVSTSLFMKPLELSMYDYGGAIRLHLIGNRVTGADELQVLPPPRNLEQLLSDHHQRLQLRRQPRASAEGKEKPKSNAKGGKEETAGGEATPPYLVYAVVHPSSKARGPSLKHHKGNLQAPEDDADAYTLDEAEAAEAATDSGGKCAAHQYTYPPGSFVDSDMVVYNIHKGRWEHFEYFHQQQLAQRRARKLQAQVEKTAAESDDNKHLAESRKDTADTAASKRASESGEACQGALVTSGGGFDADGEDVQDIHLEDILLCWIKRRLQSATMRNRSDPGWLRDSEGHIVQEGRYHIWGFEQDSQQYFYGLIPKFAKEKKNKRHNTGGSNAHNQQQQDSRTCRGSTHGTLSGPSRALSTHHRLKVGSSGGGAGTPSAYRTSPNKGIASAPEHGRSTGSDNVSVRDRDDTSPGTRSPASERSRTSSVINEQTAGLRGSHKIESKEVRSVPVTARESTEHCRASVPIPTAVTLSVSSDPEACGGSGLDTHTDAPLSVAYPDSLSKQQQQSPHLQSPGVVSRDGGSGVVSSGGGPARAATASANRSSNPRNNNSGARLLAHTSGAPRTGTSRKSPRPMSSSISSPVTMSAATAAVSYNTPGVSSRCTAGSRGPASSSPSPSATSGTHIEPEATQAERSGAAAVVCGGPSHSDSTPAPSLSSSMGVGGVAADTGASFTNPRTLLHSHDGVSHTSGRSITSHEQQFISSVSTAAPLSHESPTAPTDSVRYCKGRGDKRGYATESSCASSHPQERQQQSKPRSVNASPPPSQPPADRSYPPQPQQQQHGPRITDPGAAVLVYKGAPQSRYHAPQHQPMEYMQPPPTATCDNSSSSNSNHGGNSGAYNYPSASRASGQSYSDISLPPHSSSSPPPTLSSGVENAAYEQLHEGYPSPAQQQQQQQLPPGSSPPPHLHPPTVYMNTGAAQANLRPSSMPAGPRAPSPRHAQQRQQRATYSTRLRQQQHVSHQSYYKAQSGIANAVTGAFVQQSEMVPGPYHYHGQQQQQMTAICAPSASSAIMSTSSSRHALHPRMAGSGSVVTPMQQQQQQLTPPSAVSVAHLSALAVGNGMYSDVSAASVATSDSRAASYHPTSPSQVFYGTSSQTTKVSIQSAGLQANAVPPHTGPFSSAALPPQQQQAYPSSAMMDGSTAGRQGGAVSHGCPHQTQPPSPLKSTASAAPADSLYGQMASPTPQQHAYQQQMGPRNANYNGGSGSHNYGTYAASTANHTGSSGMPTSLLMNSNPNVNSSYSRVGPTLPATVKAMAGDSGPSMLMSTASTPLLPAGSGIGRGAQGYTLQHSGYPTSGSASLTPTPVAGMAEGATGPTSSMMPGSEGSAVNAYPPYRASQQQQSQSPPRQPSEASAGGRPAGVPSPASHTFCVTSTARKQQQQQRDSRYSLQTTAQSYSNDFGNGGAPAMRSDGRASKGVVAASDGVDSISYDDAMMHGGRGAHAAGGEFQLPYQQHQQYQQPYPKWQQQRHPNPASSQPSSSSPTPLPVQHHHQQYAAQADNGSHDGSRGHTNTQASYAVGTGNVNTSSAYAHEQETAPCPQHAAAPPPTSPAAAISSGGGQGAAAAVAVSATVGHGSPAMQSADSYNGSIATTKPAASSASTQASLGATQQQRNSDSQGYRLSRSGPTSAYSQTSQQQQQQKEPQRHPRQQRLVTRTTGVSDPFHRVTGSGIQQKAMISAGGAPPVSASHARPLPQKQQHQQQSNIQSTPWLGGYYQAVAQQQQPSVASQPLTPTPNASGTLLRVSPGLQQRYIRQNQRQQQQQRKLSPPHTSSKGAAEQQMRVIGIYSSQNAHNSNVGTAAGTCDVNNSTATQRFAHNPYAMQKERL